MAPNDSAKTRAGKLGGLLGVAVAAGRAHPTTRLPATLLGTMVPIYGMHFNFEAEDDVPNQPDDFGNYYGTEGVKRDAEADGKVDEMTNRVIYARWY